eukprot:3587859-Amphidinium_carterae.1
MACNSSTENRIAIHAVYHNTQALHPRTPPLSACFLYPNSGPPVRAQSSLIRPLRFSSLHVWEARI